MKVNVVRIGNSQGIRIPKTILQQCHLADAIELEVQGNRLVLQSLSRPRAGWEDAFRRMHAHGDDALLDHRSLSATKWERTDWRW